MAAGGSSGGTLWIKILVGGGALVAAAVGLEHGHLGPAWLRAAMLAFGGLSVVFGSCESLILCIEGIAGRAGWNKFVAGTMAGLASNVPELVMLGFVIAKEPRVGFIVVMFTLHVGALAFGLYSALLPRDDSGHAKLPRPLVKLSTDLYACAGGILFAMGALMLAMTVFKRPGQGDELAFTSTDLLVIGGFLLFVEVVAVLRLVSRFSSSEDSENLAAGPPDSGAKEEPMSVGMIVLYGAIGLGTSVVGGHAVGDFAEVLVGSLADAGYSEMVGALVLSVFAAAGAYVMAATAHAKGMYDVSLASVSGQVTQVPLVIMPIAMIQMAILAHVGVIDSSANGGVLPIDLETTSVVLLGFPTMLLLWKSIQDDGMVNWIETATMVAVFGVTIYFLAQHG